MRVGNKLVDVMHHEHDDFPSHIPNLVSPPPLVPHSESRPHPPTGSARLFQETPPNARLEKDKRESAEAEDHKATGMHRDVNAWLSQVEHGDDDEQWPADKTHHTLREQSASTTPLLSRGVQDF